MIASGRFRSAAEIVIKKESSAVNRYAEGKIKGDKKKEEWE
jgi:hypothetical protein